MNKTGNNPRTVIINLKGGIGNQLFQFAFGVYLESSNNLNVFFTDESYVDYSYSHTCVIQRLAPKVRLYRSGEIAGSNVHILNEDAVPSTLTSDALLAAMIKSSCEICLLDGYWQKTAYVDGDPLVQIKRAFDNLVSAPTRVMQPDLNDIINSSPFSVAVHIRRHDYKHHGICQENYYLDCMRWIKQQREQAEFFVFSDEPNYVSHFLNQAGIRFRMIASGDDLLDLRIMAQCKSHVVSNSTYSLWGAYLASSKLVIYPLPWDPWSNTPFHLFRPDWIGVANAVNSTIDPISFREALDELVWPI